MKNLRYTFRLNGTINVLNAKVSENTKIGVGYVLQTYHFGVEQIENYNFKDDAKSCLDCPLSYNQNNGKSGGCYTHNGKQRMGLLSMMRSLRNKLNTIHEYNSVDFNKFINDVKRQHPIDLVRFGTYGEPILLPLNVVSTLSSLSDRTTGYTHQWNKAEYKEYNRFFMASTHTDEDLAESSKLGFRSFFVAEKDYKPTNAVNCPASKESTLNLSCIKCGLCNGTKKGNKKNVYIHKH